MPIYKLTFENGRIDFCTAKDQLHLLKSYDTVFDLAIQEVESIDEITEKEAKEIMIRNTEYDPEDPEGLPEEISLHDLLSPIDGFAVIASNEE